MGCFLKGSLLTKRFDHDIPNIALDIWGCYQNMLHPLPITAGKPFRPGFHTVGPTLFLNRDFKPINVNLAGTLESSGGIIF